MMLRRLAILSAVLLACDAPGSSGAGSTSSLQAGAPEPESLVALPARPLSTEEKRFCYLIAITYADMYDSPVKQDYRANWFANDCESFLGHPLPMRRISDDLDRAYSDSMVVLSGGVPMPPDPGAEAAGQQRYCYAIAMSLEPPAPNSEAAQRWREYECTGFLGHPLPTEPISPQQFAAYGDSIQALDRRLGGCGVAPL